LADTKGFLQGVHENTGFALNPGWPFGFELAPEGLQHLLIRFAVKKHSGKTDQKKSRKQNRLPPQRLSMGLGK